MSDATYPYDPAVRDAVVQLLYDALPAIYRVRDEPPRGREELKALLSILAVPLATVRQSVEELHADLFIDSCADAVIPLLADMVGTELVFPDDDSNRRDVRGSVRWRRRKGTPAMLQEMASELADRLVVTSEGWKRVQLAQDLDLIRPERVALHLRPPIVAEQVDGPMDAAAHVVDVRAVGRRTGRYHPRHVVHWRHPTRLWPLVNGVAHDLKAPVKEHRFTFHPLGEDLALRVRRTDPTDAVDSDRVPPLHFAADPGAWFGRDGRFDVRICGLTAGVASPGTLSRAPSKLGAHPSLLRGGATVVVLERDARRQLHDVTIELHAAAPPASVPGSPALGAPVGAITLHPDGTQTEAPGAAVVDPDAVVVMQLVVGVTTAWFPGATLEVRGADDDATHASADPDLAREGFLRGALVVRVPAGWIAGSQRYYVAADGSVSDAGSGAAPLAEVGGSIGAWTLPAAVETGPGPAWPPTEQTASDTWSDAAPGAPRRGPRVLHGGRVLDATAPTPTRWTRRAALTFAITWVSEGVRRFLPFSRLAWTGSDPGAASARWQVIDATGALTDLEAIRAHLAEVASKRADAPSGFRLLVRFESANTSAVLPPSELAWTSDDGETILIHLPERVTGAGASFVDWPSSLAAVSDPVAVADDGSTRAWDSDAVLRYALGAVTPLREAGVVRRRVVGYRNLCPWRNETATRKHHPTSPGRLDVDPAHGLFSFVEEAQGWAKPALAALGDPPASVTVCYEEGYTAHVGALPAAREPVLDMRQPDPTRLVVGAGALHPAAPSSWHDLPRYATIQECFAAIAADHAAGGGDDHEVVQIEDSATYPDCELEAWPVGPGRLTLQSAEGERPTLILTAPATPSTATYEELTLRGFAFSGAVATLPEAQTVALQFLTANDATAELRIPAGDLEVVRCRLAGLRLGGGGELRMSDSVLDAEDGVALATTEASVSLERVTVRGTVDVFALEASEVIFTHRVEVADRFQGCVRYSRVTSSSLLPRRHRVVEDVEVRFVSRLRHDPAHLRLDDRCDRRIRRGAEDASEMGAFHDVQAARRADGLARRLDESTPAGLITGILRLD